MTALPPLVSTFLNKRLPVDRGASEHTTDSYAYALKLLFEYASTRLSAEPSRLQLEQLDAPLILDFLSHLERNRGNSAATRNVRLAAVKSFMRYVQYEVPSALEQIARILAIPNKRTDQPVTDYLSPEETQALIDAPDLATQCDLRDRAMLLITVELGLRVSELVGIRMEDVTLGSTPKILIRGKNRRERELPLSRNLSSALRAWLAVRGQQPVPEIFLNARGLTMTRSGFAYILAKYIDIAAQQCPSLQSKHVTPHVLRHTCAMDTLRATGNVHMVSLWLGHASERSTQRYLHSEPSEKLAIIEKRLPSALKLRNGQYRPSEQLLEVIKAATLCGANKKNGPRAVRHPPPSSA